MDQEDFISLILSTYEATESISQTARQLNISHSKARKALITAGAWENDKSVAIRNLREQGLSDDEIAAELNISLRVINALSPYQRPIYDVNPSENAQKIKEWRFKKEANGNTTT